MFRQIFKARFSLPENVEWQLKDKDGNIKKLFKFNFLGKFFYRLFKLDCKTFLFGSYVDKLVISNLITNAGMAGVASRINGSGGEAAFTYIALGTDNTAADVTDTTLGAEITTNGGERASAAVSRTTTDVTNDTAQWVNTFNFTGSFAIVESGVLNAGASGVLLSHQVFSTINVVSGDSLQVTWKTDVD